MSTTFNFTLMCWVSNLIESLGQHAELARQLVILELEIDVTLVVGRRHVLHVLGEVLQNVDHAIGGLQHLPKLVAAAVIGAHAQVALGHGLDGLKDLVGRHHDGLANGEAHQQVDEHNDGTGHANHQGELEGFKLGIVHMTSSPP